jgi:hypothetical protein
MAGNMPQYVLIDADSLQSQIMLKYGMSSPQTKDSATQTDAIEV